MLRSVGIDSTKMYASMCRWSLEHAITQQGLSSRIADLRRVVPDISDQYTSPFEEDDYQRFRELKMRAMHAFQFNLTLEAIRRVGRPRLVLADIGDSSGNHAAYLKALTAPDELSAVVGINLDPVAVEKIRAKGHDAMLCRAEELAERGIRADVLTSFETLEHLTDPLRFLHSLATNVTDTLLVITVPYRRVSRFGGYELRQPLDRMPMEMNAESLHILELSETDWVRLARFAGWRPVTTSVLWQYPRGLFTPALRHLWAETDFEGFFGAIFEQDLSVASRYRDW
jgi:SAM-dependent methyltransferase